MSELSDYYRDLLPQGTADLYEAKPLGSGARMDVFKSKCRGEVLRVPHRSEAELIAATGESTEVSGQSKLTQQEILRHRLLCEHLEDSVVAVRPFTAIDGRGRLRTYSTQNYVRIARDMGDLYSSDVIEAKTHKSLRLFIDRVRKLILSSGLIPDLGGRNNTVIDTSGNVVLLDVNNVNPLLGDDWVRPGAENMSAYDVVRSWDTPQNMLHLNYLDDKKQPIADFSLWILSQWERRFGHTRETLDQDELYGRLRRGSKRDTALSHLVHDPL